MEKNTTKEEFARSLKYAKTAFSHLKSNSIPCSPQNYEVWYNYAAGYNPRLNREINEILRNRGTITVEEIEQLNEEILSPTRLGERIEKIGGKVSAEVEDVMTIVSSAIGSTSNYSDTLKGASDKLSSACDSGAIKKMVSDLIATTKAFEAANRELETELADRVKQIEELRTSIERVRNESLRDPLTDLANRKRFDQALETSIAESRKTDRPMTLLMTDIDHFKKFNDTFGHQTGDQVLRLVASILRQNVKGRDIACRYGGEEFAVILPRTNLNQATIVAEHIRKAILGKELVKRSTGESLGRITVSIGIAALSPKDDASSLIERADQCLYAAKNRGRNRVICETELDVEAAVA